MQKTAQRIIDEVIKQIFNCLDDIVISGHQPLCWPVGGGGDVPCSSGKQKLPETHTQQILFKVFKKLGNAGLLGVNKPVEYGGMGLDFKYDLAWCSLLMLKTLYRFSVALNETLGNIHCGGVPMSIAVQTDMATPALARLKYLYTAFNRPNIAGIFCRRWYNYFIIRD